MRGRFWDQGGLFSYLSPEARVPPRHPLRQIRELVRTVLKELSVNFGKLYSSEGRPSIPPEQLLSALLLQVFYGIRSERQLMEQLDYNLLYRWFVGLAPDDPVWNATTFTKNRERLQQGDVFQKFMTKLLHHSQVKPLLSDEHFSVDGTLIEAWASQKSFRAKDGGDNEGDGGNFRGQKRSNVTHASITDPKSRLYRKAGCAVSFPIPIRRCALSCSSRRRCHRWLSCRHRSSRSPCQIVVKLGIGDANGRPALARRLAASEAGARLGHGRRPRQGSRDAHRSFAILHLLFGHEPQDGAKASKPHPEKLGQALAQDG
jgi:transposase